MPTRSDSPGPWMTGALILAALWWLVDLAVLGSGTPDRLDDTWEYGVAARALLEGHGFRTLVIHPPLWGLQDAAGTVPVLVHGPLVPLLLAPLLALAGPAALDGIAWLAALGAILAVPPIVRLGERCGHPAIGFAAAALWTVAPLTAHSVHHDVALPIGAALLAGAIELATRERPRLFAAGLALGLGCLARHEMLAALPLLALFAGASGWRLLGGALLALAPWWLHHLLAVGQPLFNLSSYLLIGYWGERPGISVMRDFALTPERFPAVLRSEWREVLAKAVSYAPHAVKRALLAPIPALGWLAALGGLFALVRPATRRVAWLAIGLAAIPIVVMSVTLYDERYLVPFLPLFALGAARGAHDLARRLPAWAHRPRAWIGLLALVAIPAALPALREEAAQSRRDRGILAGERQALARWMASRADSAAAPGSTRPRILFSDTPDFVAWTTGRTTVWLAPEDLPRLRGQRIAGPPIEIEPGSTWFHPNASLP